MHLPELEVAATCVRLPIETGHSESVYVELESNDATVDDIKSILKDAPGITLQDDPSQQIYPMPADAVGKTTYLSAAFGRIWIVQMASICGLYLITC